MEKVARKALSDVQHVLERELVGAVDRATMEALATALDECTAYVHEWTQYVSSNWGLV